MVAFVRPNEIKKIARVTRYFYIVIREKRKICTLEFVTHGNT